jgi:hypothetical protein
MLPGAGEQGLLVFETEHRRKDDRVSGPCTWCNGY